MDFADGGLQTITDGAIGWLVLNRPDRLNAVNHAMWESLPAAVASLEADPQIRIVIVRGAGERAFASGADIAEFDVVRADAATNHAFTSLVTAATSSILNSPLPFVAMIRGFCIGGGVVIATACDMRVCAEDARFAVPAARLGLAYELDNFSRLQRQVGAGTAMEMLMTARQFDAQEALGSRLVERVVPVDQLESETRRLADLVIANAPLTISAAKHSSRAAFDPGQQAAAQDAIDRCFESADFGEGRVAFREKRAPRFQGR